MEIVENVNCGKCKLYKWKLWKMEIVENGYCGKLKLWEMEIVEKGKLWKKEIVINENCGKWKLCKMEFVEIIKLRNLEIPEMGNCELMLISLLGVFWKRWPLWFSDDRLKKQKFDPVFFQVLSRPDHCGPSRESWGVFTCLLRITSSRITLDASQCLAVSKQFKGPTHLQPYCFFGECSVGLHPVWLYPLSETWRYQKWIRTLASW